MGLVLIVVGLGIAYLCWVQKKEIDYVEKKNHENSIGNESILDRRKRVGTKILNSEKLTTMEWLDWHLYKVVYGALKCGIYIGFAVSILGVILWIIDKIQAV